MDFSKYNKFRKNSKDTDVGCFIQGSLIHLDQFTLALIDDIELHFLAIGQDSKSALYTVIDAEKSFNPNNFDEDGYSI